MSRGGKKTPPTLCTTDRATKNVAGRYPARKINKAGREKKDRENRIPFSQLAKGRKSSLARERTVPKEKEPEDTLTCRCPKQTKGGHRTTPREKKRKERKVKTPIPGEPAEI